jgi:hypothetical protein
MHKCIDLVLNILLTKTPPEEILSRPVFPSRPVASKMKGTNDISGIAESSNPL